MSDAPDSSSYSSSSKGSPQLEVNSTTIAKEGNSTLVELNNKSNNDTTQIIGTNIASKSNNISTTTLTRSSLPVSGSDQDQ